ncbi:MAG: tyrosine-type recombinase/integrase [Nostoc sp.]
MVNSSKTPTGKSKKGQVTVREDSGSVKACFPRTHFADEKQVKLATGISLVDGWESKAAQLQRRLQLELDEGKLGRPDGTFSKDRYREILIEYGFKPNLRVVESVVTSDDQLPPKPDISLMEVWDMYCEYRKHQLAETTYRLDYRDRYPRMLKQAIDSVGENPIQIRNWLIENRDMRQCKKLLSLMSKACALQVTQGMLARNFFDGLSADVEDKKRVKVINQEVEDVGDNDVLDRTKAYTWDEALLILDFVKNDSIFRHWHPYLKFKFLTGCRSGEVSALWWSDVKWDKEQILIRRGYNSALKIFKPTKNETCRIFPMPKDGELWNLLKSIPQGEANEVVFKSKRGAIIGKDTFNAVWHGIPCQERKGIIHTLMESRRLSKYLPPYNTRHTFITHQIFDLGRDEKVVNAWCEHSEAISRKHYQDIADRATQINPELPASRQAQQQSELDLLKEQMRKQQELIDKLLQDK